MIKIPAKQAITEFDDLLSKVSSGKEVVIVGADGSTFKLVALSRSPKPIFGSAKGLVEINPGFDDPIEGFEDYVQ